MTTIHHPDGHSIPAIIQKVLPKGRELASIKGIDENTIPRNNRTQRLFLYEYVIGAGDRHGGNYWMDSRNKVYSIDHGRSFRENISTVDLFGVAGYGGALNKLNGYWPRVSNNGTNKAYGLDRKLVQHVVSRSKDLLVAAKESRGWNNPNPPEVGMQKRLNFLSSALQSQEGPVHLPVSEPRRRRMIGIETTSGIHFRPRF